MTQKYGSLANAEEFDREKPCLVCDDPHPTFSWTDYSGEGYCLKCGTPYQLKWGKLAEGETYPRFNLAEHAIPALRAFYAETGKPNGLGTFMIFDIYQDQLHGRQAFNAWCEDNYERFPEIRPKEGA